MQLKQYYLGCLAHASYLIGDEKSKTAAVVDPQRDIEQYLKDAEAHGWTIKHVLLTHFHADFLAGHIELRDRTEANIYLGAKAEAEYEFTPLKEGDVIEYGDVRLKTLETPGHTPEGVSILVYDLESSGQDPYAVLTGDTLFIGDVGRPDLLASIGVTADELAEMLYDSLTHKLIKLPDDTLVYPAHGAGSLCGKNLSDETVSTIGEQKKYNYAPPTDEQGGVHGHGTGRSTRCSRIFCLRCDQKSRRTSLARRKHEAINDCSQSRRCFAIEKARCSGCRCQRRN